MGTNHLVPISMSLLKLFRQVRQAFQGLLTTGRRREREKERDSEGKRGRKPAGSGNEPWVSELLSLSQQRENHLSLRLLTLSLKHSSDVQLRSDTPVQIKTPPRQIPCLHLSPATSHPNTSKMQGRSEPLPGACGTASDVLCTVLYGQTLPPPVQRLPRVLQITDANG